jgi:hypothetical protein
MDQLTHLFDSLHTNLISTLSANPSLIAGAGLAAVALAYLLFRKPRIQREADARLSALRRDKNDEYSRLRLPR